MIHPLANRLLGVGILAATVTLGFAAAVNQPSYVAPDLKLNIFDGTLKGGAQMYAQTATSLADIVRNQLTFTDPKDYRSAGRLLGIALRLDPRNRAAMIVEGELENGDMPKPAANWVLDDSLKQIRILANTAKASNQKPDRMLAAYLYSAIILVSPNDDDMYEAQLIKQSGCEITWSWSGNEMRTPPHHRNVNVEEPAEVKPLTRINSLVVSPAPDGVMYGKVLQIIAARAEGPFHRIQLIGTVGREMKTSLDEAIRLAKLRNDAAARAAIDISFSEKYTEKDGGSAGTAFALLILSAVGDFPLDPNAAITGDITVDGKVGAVGMVYAKVHGASIDHCSVAVIPAANEDQMRDSFLLNGLSAYWEIQTFRIDALDDAIALMRSDRDEKLQQAVAQFDAFKAEQARKPLLNAPASVEKLKNILQLAPNHVSAKLLLEVATGNKPSHLTLLTTLNQSISAVGDMSPGLSDFMATNPDRGTAEAYQAARKNLHRIEAMGDPRAAPVFSALDNFCRAYAVWGNAERSDDIRRRFSTKDDYEKARKNVPAVIRKIVSDPAVFEKLLRGNLG